MLVRHDKYWATERSGCFFKQHSREHQSHNCNNIIHVEHFFSSCLLTVSLGSFFFVVDLDINNILNIKYCNVILLVIAAKPYFCEVGTSNVS